MNPSTVFMFSGQGSQYYHMGKELFDHHPVFRKWMLQLDDMAREIAGKSIVAEIYNEEKKRSDIFDQILYTHPAIFMVEYALARVFVDNGICPDYVLGASLGEFTAAAVAKVAPVEEILACVMKQAQDCVAHCPPGGMLAIIHSPNIYDQTPLLNQNSELVSVNFHTHFVVAGASDKLREIMGYLKQKEIMFQLLPVTYGFHSASVDPMEEAFKSYLQTKTFQKPNIPFLSCLHGKQVSEIPSVYFWDLVRQPIRFQAALGSLEQYQTCVYVDLGPSGTLANFTRYNLAKDSGSRYFSIMTPFQQEQKNLKTIEDLLDTGINY